MADDTLLTQLWIAAALIASTTFFHAVVVAAAAAFFRAAKGRAHGFFRFFSDAITLVLISLMLMAAHAVEIYMWARTFLALEIFTALEPALYFAAVSYTTLGFGDILVEPPWRLLSGAAAANGLLLFGLSAAFLVDIGARLRLAD